MANYKFCPLCSSNLENQKVRSHERLVCNSCGFVFYQNPKPTVGVFIVENSRILLAKRGIDPFKGFWDSIGGFMENDEAPQETALRETKEETGLDIEITNLIGMGKDLYNGDHIVPIAFEAKIVGGEISPQDDVSDLQWFELSNLPSNIAFSGNRKVLELLKTRYAKK